MQLEKSYSEMMDADYSIFAISYDPVSTLHDFSEKHGISFDLLSDDGSSVMASIGMVDNDIAQRQAYFGTSMKERHRGLPYPGTFFLDDQGLVTEKHFEASYRDRETGSYLIDRVVGTSGYGPNQSLAQRRGIALRAWTSESSFRPLMKSLLHVEVQLDQGFHTYVDPVPSGYTSLALELLPSDGVVSWPAEVPGGHPLVIPGLDEEFVVIDSTTRIDLPFKISGSLYLSDGRKRVNPLSVDVVTLTMAVRFQVCSDLECFPPEVAWLAIPLTEESLLD